MRIRSRATTNGCGFLMLTCAVTCIFLLFNVAITAAAFSWLAQRFHALREAKITQMVMYACPMLLTFVEWWLVDALSERISPRGSR